MIRSGKIRTKLAALILFTGIILFFTSCMTVSVDTSQIRQPVSMTLSINREYKLKKHFRIEQRAWFTVKDLVTISNPEIQGALKQELAEAEGDAIVNLTILEQNTFFDFLIPVATTIAGYSLLFLTFDIASEMELGVLVAIPVIFGPLLNSRTYVVEGDIVVYID